MKFDVVFLLVPILVIGIVVRYRSTYYPKADKEGDAEIALPLTPDVALHPADATRTDGQKDVADTTGENGASAIHLEDMAGANHIPKLVARPGFLRVLKNVGREEKFEGVLKGLFPGLLSVFFLRNFISPGPCIPQRQTHSWIFIYNAFYIPFLVATYRIIVSPHKLRFGAPKAIYRNTFSEYERQHPFRAIQYSTLILPFLGVLCFDLFIVNNLRKSIGEIRTIMENFDPEEDITRLELVKQIYHHLVWREIGRLASYPLLAAVMAIFMTPVDVIMTRLAIQPVQGPPQPIEERDFEKTVAPQSYL